MSMIDNFMSQVIDLNETEKEETILFLATALVCGDPATIKNISRKVTLIVMPFLVDVLLYKIKENDKGGERFERAKKIRNGIREMFEEDQGLRT
jgi:hypothetical protein